MKIEVMRHFTIQDRCPYKFIYSRVFTELFSEEVFRDYLKKEAIKSY